MVCEGRGSETEPKGSETVLTGVLEDRSAVFGVLAQIEGLGLELLELREIRDSSSFGGDFGGAGAAGSLT